MLIDESGLMMAPLVRRTQAPRGQTPVLRQKGSHRDRVSVIAALSYPPVRSCPTLYFQTLPRAYVNSERAVVFLRHLLRHVRGPVIVLWDRGSMHKGPALRQLQADVSRLSIEALPPYAPELNPVEDLWNYLKYDELANYLPDSVDDLHATVVAELQRVKSDRRRLATFLSMSQLPLLGPTLAN